MEICYNDDLPMKMLTLPFRVKRPVLACGADLKGAFALANGDKAYLFDGPSAGSGPVPSLSRDGFGDLAELDNFTRYEKAIGAAKKKLKINPQIIVCDMHPGYFSVQFAESLQLKAHSLKLCRAQHHEAHIASAIVDNNIKGSCFGAAFDGTGYGPDGNIWGGEFFSGGLKSLKRIAHLEYIPMPGGEMCINQPWRMAASYLYSAFGPDFLKLKVDFVKKIDKKSWAILKEMIDKRVNSPLTSSMGRLFDAAGSIILNRNKAEFEAQLPIELEKMAAKNIDDSYSSVNGTGIIRGIAKDMEKKADIAIISAKFHNSVAGMILAAAKEAKMKRVVLSGGVFQNRYLRNRTLKLLSKNGFKAYEHSGVETNDSGIPLGQIAIANARFSACA